MTNYAGATIMSIGNMKNTLNWRDFTTLNFFINFILLSETRLGNNNMLRIMSIVDDKNYF